jgi:hypothetical protein
MVALRALLCRQEHRTLSHQRLSRDQYQRPRPYQPPPPTSRKITMMIRSVVVSTLPSLR